MNNIEIFQKHKESTESLFFDDDDRNKKIGKSNLKSYNEK